MTLFDTIYDSYAYSYPHKHAYRKLPPIPLSDCWDQEKKDALFLYIHLPFCEMRCGFCNLFTIAHPQQAMVDAYLDTLTREAAVIKELIAPQSFAQMAVGGGTPTFLSLSQLERLFHLMRELGARPEQSPLSFEMSPKTIDRDKLDFLASQGVDRVSMGIQSFLETEVKALGRPQHNKEVYTALDLLKETGFPTLNIDLIYGAYGQTLDSWLYSIREAIRYEVDELFIYPLYVRPLTGINKLSQTETDLRPLFYRAAKEELLAAGYQQISMRLFRKNAAAETRYSCPPTNYSCQEDGMIGLGSGARSYTKAVHYSSEYAVARNNIKSIIEKYINNENFNHIDYGIQLNTEEQQRRFIIKSLLHNTGLDTARYQTLFGHEVADQYPKLNELKAHGLAMLDNQVLRLTPEGIDYSDAIGPWLYSDSIKYLIHEFELQ